MENFAEAIEAAARGEAIESIVIGSVSCGDDLEVPDAFEKTLSVDALLHRLSWDVARPMLDRKYDDGFGGGCPPIYAWTASRVITVHEYDGSTTVGAVPRHPTDDWAPTFA